MVCAEYRGASESIEGFGVAGSAVAAERVVSGFGAVPGDGIAAAGDAEDGADVASDGTCLAAATAAV